MRPFDGSIEIRKSDRLRYMYSGAKHLKEGQWVTVEAVFYLHGRLHMKVDAVKDTLFGPGCWDMIEEAQRVAHVPHWTVDAIWSSQEDLPMRWRTVYVDGVERGRIYSQVIDGPVEYHPATKSDVPHGYEFAERWFVSEDVALHWLMDPQSVNE